MSNEASARRATLPEEGVDECAVVELDAVRDAAAGLPQRSAVYEMWFIDMGYWSSTCSFTIDMVILDIDMGYGITMWEMTVSI
jgi:hypothetical protein